MNRIEYIARNAKATARILQGRMLPEPPAAAVDITELDKTLYISPFVDWFLLSAAARVGECIHTDTRGAGEHADAAAVAVALTLSIDAMENALTANGRTVSESIEIYGRRFNLLFVAVYDALAAFYRRYRIESKDGGHVIVSLDADRKAEESRQARIKELLAVFDDWAKAYNDWAETQKGAAYSAAACSCPPYLRPYRDRCAAAKIELEKMGHSSPNWSYWYD